ncbi:MAG: signal peptidase II, partial [Spirochaetales bacterium]|nr:signal peptidase II [Spirochaetales bacterium]
MSILIMLLVVIADWLIKEGIRAQPVGTLLYATPLFHIVHTENSGVAFSLLADRPGLVLCFGLALLSLLLVYAFRRTGGERV